MAMRTPAFPAAPPAVPMRGVSQEQIPPPFTGEKQERSSLTITSTITPMSHKMIRQRVDVAG